MSRGKRKKPQVDEAFGITEPNRPMFHLPWDLWTGVPDLWSGYPDLRTVPVSVAPTGGKAVRIRSVNIDWILFKQQVGMTGWSPVSEIKDRLVFVFQSGMIGNGFKRRMAENRGRQFCFLATDSFKPGKALARNFSFVKETIQDYSFQEDISPWIFLVFPDLYTGNQIYSSRYDCCNIFLDKFCVHVSGVLPWRKT
jgi:hypothetical protein